ncbi:response regulator [Paenibacillus thailandensis]|uniref:Response regulator n=1 Tax=Paenibacillus thailandensis TaxID=393250 RepID=A0ABW5QUD0_9BACL
MKIRVLIADDNSFIREGMRIILNTFDDFEVLAAVEDGREAVDYCMANEVDVVLLDVRMPNMNGVEATKQIVRNTDAKPIILTTFDDDEFVFDAIRNGAKGYLLKNNEPERIRDAIKSVYGGNNVLQDVVLDKLKAAMTGGFGESGTTASAIEPGNRNAVPSVPAAAGTEDGRAGGAFDRSPFTERELDVMALIAKGYSNKEISKELYISEGTTANYITSILNKTGLEHRTQIAIYYLTGKVR